MSLLRVSRRAGLLAPPHGPLGRIQLQFLG